MTSLRAAARAARDRLRAAGIDDPEIEAELLLRHAITPDGAVTRAALFTRYEESIDSGAVDRYEAFVARRLAHEPSAYITGHREFHGLDLLVSPAVLIPRPETEALVGTTLDAARSRRGHPCPLRIADIGTGSGAVAIAVALALPATEVYATDVSRDALAVAQANAGRHGVERRIAFRRGHLLEPVHDYVDLIVANLPYVTTTDWERLPPELRDHEPRLALDGGDDGLGLVKALLRQAPRYLRPGGAVYLEIGDGQAEAIGAFIASEMPPAISWSVRTDFGGIPRVLTVW